MCLRQHHKIQQMLKSSLEDDHFQASTAQCRLGWGFKQEWQLTWKLEEARRLSPEGPNGILPVSAACSAPVSCCSISKNKPTSCTSGMSCAAVPDCHMTQPICYLIMIVTSH